MRLEAVELRLLSLHLRRPHRSAAGEESTRPVVVVRIQTDAGEGWGECAALATPSYSAEYALGAYEALGAFLVPALLGAWGAGDDLGAAFTLDGIHGHHMAKAALDMAMLDASLRTCGRSLAEHLGVVAPAVPAGGVVSMAPIDAVIERVGTLVATGYHRVKVKIGPGHDLEPLAALREHFPDVPLQADANGAYRTMAAAHGAAAAAVPGVLAALDGLGLLCLEQPLAADDLVGHARLAAAMATPLCLDESIASLGRLDIAVALGACGVVCVKPGPLGGIGAAVAALDRCWEAGLDAWVGGMLETGLGRAVNATLAALPACTMVGDVGGGPRFVEDDPFGVVDLDDGQVPLYRGPGVGPAPDEEALRSVTVRFDRVVPD